MIHLGVAHAALEAHGAVGQGEAELVHLGPAHVGPGEHVEAAGGAEHEVHVAPLSRHQALSPALLEDVSRLLGVIPGLGGRGWGQWAV